MPRPAKSRDPTVLSAVNKAASAWMRNEIDFQKIEESLGKPLSKDRREHLEFMLAFRLETMRRPPRQSVRAGRPPKNQEWNDVIVTLAAIFQITHRRKAAVISWGQDRGPFLKFVTAVFQEIPQEMRPANTATALPTLIKRALSQRKAVQPWPMSREELRGLIMHPVQK
jgi:hypothetical protein